VGNPTKNLKLTTKNWAKMFTGLIEDIGKVYRWQMRRESGILAVNTHLPLRDFHIGSSIAVNGVCLTVIAKGKNRFSVDVSPETLKRTSFNKLKAGDPVNLERSLRLGDRLGGHWVTGHVDGIATIEEIKKRGDFTFFLFRAPASLHSLLAPKGSVAVDGISLTLNDCKRQCFSVAVIPFTLNRTNLRVRRVGDKVNVETDIVARYIKRLTQRK
jgi:riboflavin synthase